MVLLIGISSIVMVMRMGCMKLRLVSVRTWIVSIHHLVEVVFQDCEIRS